MSNRISGAFLNGFYKQRISDNQKLESRQKSRLENRLNSRQKSINIL